MPKLAAQPDPMRVIHRIAGIAKVTDLGDVVAVEIQVDEVLRGISGRVAVEGENSGATFDKAGGHQPV